MAGTRSTLAESANDLAQLPQADYRERDRSAAARLGVRPMRSALARLACGLRAALLGASARTTTTGLERYELRKNSCLHGGSGGNHCDHWMEGDSDCCWDAEPRWCPDEGEDAEWAEQ